MKIFITGGAGFIGSHLVDRLLADPAHTVTVYDNLSRGSLINLQHHAPDGRLTFVEGDIEDVPHLSAALRGAKVVFHLAAIATVMDSERDPARTFRVNAQGTDQVLRAAQATGVCRVIHASSREVYGEVEHLPVLETHPIGSKNTYGASKAEAEAVCARYIAQGLPVTILRLANVYGPRDVGRVIPLFINCALRGQALTLYGGQQILDLVWVGDVVEAMWQAAFRSEWIAEPVNVGSGLGLSIHELAQRVVALSRSTSTVRLEPPRQMEVVRFVADLTRFRHYFPIPIPTEPVARLAEVIAWAQAQAI